MESIKVPSAMNHQDSVGAWTQEAVRSPGLVSGDVPYVGLQVNCPLCSIKISLMREFLDIQC